MRATVAKRLKKQARREFAEGGIATNLRYNELKKAYKIKPVIHPVFKRSKRELRKVIS